MVDGYARSPGNRAPSSYTRTWPSGAELPSPPSLPMSFCSGGLVLLDKRRRLDAEDFKLEVSSVLLEVSPELSEIASSDRPTLLEHACTDDRVPGEVTVPHLVEHLAIDLLVERQRAFGGGVVFAGYTLWLDKRAGLAKVTLSAPEHAVTETAMVLACGLVSEYMEILEGRHG